MFSIVARFTTSLMGLMGESASDAEVEIRVEEIRRAMLDIMSEFLVQQARRPALWDKVSYASSIQTLWYLRIDLMARLSAHCGETVAREKLATITEKFRGVLPAHQMSKSDRFRQ